MVVESLVAYGTAMIVGGSLVAIYFLHRDLAEAEEMMEQARMTLWAVLKLEAAIHVIEQYNLDKEYQREVDRVIEENPRAREILDEGDGEIEGIEMEGEP